MTAAKQNKTIKEVATSSPIFTNWEERRLIIPSSQNIIARRTTEDYVRPELTQCFWLTEEHEKKAEESLRRLMQREAKKTPKPTPATARGNAKSRGVTKEPTKITKKPRPKIYHVRNEDKTYLVLFSELSEQSIRSGDFPKRAFKEPKKWVHLFHQTAGYACHHHYMEARFLAPTKKIGALMEELKEAYNDSCITNPTLETANEYEAVLKKYGLSANRTAFDLEEGFYPIDIEYLPKVTGEKFPKNLMDLCKEIPKEGKTARRLGLFGWRHFGLAILGPNCD
jgi:hypothetical protein